MDRCSACPGLNKVVLGGGNPCSDYVFIGEAPGPDEDKRGICFSGKTGQELNEQYLPLAGLHRPNVYVTNIIKCLPPGDGKIDMKDAKQRNMAEVCARHHLYKEIKRVNPRIIVPMGAFASSQIPDINLELHHSMPFQWDIGPDVGSYTVFPMWHPAQGLYDHKRIGTLRTDFIRLKKFMQGRLVVPQDKYPDPVYDVIRRPGDVHQILGWETSNPIAIDTETTRKRQPFCLTFSVQPGTGYMIRMEDKDSLAVFAEYMQAWESEILIHNSLFDIYILMLMGVQIPRKRIVDTMMKIFHLQNMPQGLKTVSYRLMGMQMQDFDDLVRPHSESRVLSFFAQMMNYKWEKPDPFVERDKHGKWVYHQPQSLNTKLKRFFTDYGKNPELDIFERWDKWGEDRQKVEELVGEYPGKCITHAPFEEVLHYACRDADATLRLWPIIKRATQRQRRQPDYEWWEDAA